ncbi:hypothetical protein D3C76_1335210 [compost metagenome]
MHIVTVNPADLKRSNPHVFADTMILMNDIITDFELCVALDPFSIINSLRQLTRFALLLGEHFTLGDDSKMNGRQLKT